MSNSPSNRIAAVVVTYNRLTLLKGVIEALRAQTRPVDEIIVINNGSTDETRTWLEQQTGLTVVHQENLGGAGGFFTGIDAAYRRKHDWFWCMDDDTFPEPEALERLVAAPAFNDPATGFMGSLVLWTDGEPHLMNTPGTTHQTSWFHKVLTDRCVRVEHCSFVSVMIARRAVARVGLPMRDFFIWHDDAEYTGRISNVFKCYVVLDSRAIHRTAQNLGATVEKVTPAGATKYLYGVRNRIIVLRRQPGHALVRWVEIARVIGAATKRAIRGRAPWAGVLWAFRGLTYRTKPQFPDEA
jgi:GT2 family glycosyltransferase